MSKPPLAIPSQESVMHPQTARHASRLLDFPLEIRLQIYSLVACSPKSHNLNFTLSHANNSSLSPTSPPTFSRSGFRGEEWRATACDKEPEPPYADTAALYNTCRQINNELREIFHPGRLALTIRDDEFFTLCSEEKMYEALESRPWLSSHLEIVRLEILRMHQNRVFSTIQQDLSPLIEFLKCLPQLEKIQILIRSSNLFHCWTDPLRDLQALKPIRPDTYDLCIVVGAGVTCEKKFRAMVAEQAGEHGHEHPGKVLKGNFNDWRYYKTRPAKGEGRDFRIVLPGKGGVVPVYRELRQSTRGLEHVH